MPKLTPYQQMWLNEIGFTDLDQVKTCDPDRQTITLLDGRVRQKTEVFSRIMGYHRPINAANKGKQQEHRDRKFFRMPAQMM
jgi:hypothetical protein